MDLHSVDIHQPSETFGGTRIRNFDDKKLIGWCLELRPCPRGGSPECYLTNKSSDV